MRIKDIYRFFPNHNISKCSVERNIKHLIFSVNILVQQGFVECPYDYPDKYEHTVEVRIFNHIVTYIEFKAASPHLEMLTSATLDLLGCENFTDYDMWAEHRYFKQENN